MANQEHLDILMQGVEAWNTWRKEHPNVIPDLSNAYLNGIHLSNANLSNTDLSNAYLIDAELISTNLSGASLSGAYLSDTHLSNADLSNAYLSRATLSNAYLSNANLSNAYLSGAQLSEADLISANFSHSNLSGAHLIEANLIRANFNHANLSGARLSGATLIRANLSHADFQGTNIGWTTFGDLDLRTVKGLETIRHHAPSTIGLDTIYRSGGNIPEAFLRGAGIDDTFIEYMHSLVGKPIKYNSCFISHSSENREFAERLHADLQSKNIRCWYAPHDMKTGDRIRTRIYEQIWFNDKLLLILSESSVKSSWVEYEVETVLARERKENRDILFPIRLDDAVMESTTAWAAHIQEARHITDFTRWKEHDEYQKGLSRLLRDLKQEALHDTIESDADQDEMQSTSRERQS